MLSPLAVLDFAVPGLLWTLPVAAVPLLLHLLFRQRPVQVPFPAVRLLLSLRRQTTRRFRLRQVLLLAVRTALLAGAVVALAGPRWRAGPAAEGPAPDRLNAVFVLDTSCSMSAVRPDGSSRLDRANALALQALELLSADSRAALILCADRPRRVVEALTYDRDAVADAIQQSRWSYRSTNCPVAIAEALRMLQDQRAHGPGAVFLFTDLTANGWPAGDRPTAERPVSVYVVDVGDEKILNRLVALPGGRRMPAIAGVPFQVTARAAVPAPLAPATAELRVQGEFRGEAKLDDERRPQAAFRFAPLQAGAVTGSVALRGRDAVAADDRAYFAVRCIPPSEVLVVDGGAAEGQASAGQELAAALRPRGPGEAPQFHVRLAVPEGVRADALEGADAVVLANVPSLTAAQWRVLADHVREGGRLLVLGGPHVQPAGYSAAAEGKPPLLPCAIRAVVRRRSGVRIQGLRERHPMGRRLASLQAKGTGPIFTEYLEAGPAAADAVVLRFETGEPALMEHSFGRGRAMVFAGAPGPAEAWRAFARGLLRYASTEAEPLWHPIGEPVRVESGQGVVRSARLRGRSDDRWRELSLPDDQPPTSVLLPPQDEAGLYEVELTTDAGTEIRPLALNIDPEETTPRRLSVGELAGRLPGVPCRVLNGAEQLRTLLTAAGRVVDLNQDLVPMLLVLLVLELLLAGRLYGRAPEAGDAHQRTRQIRQVR